MAASTKSAARYATFDDSRSSIASSNHSSDQSSCSTSDLKKPSSKNPFSFKKLNGNPSSRQTISPSGSASPQILARTKSAGALAPARAAKNDQGFGSMVKKFMEKKKKPEVAPTLQLANDDLKKVLAGPAKGGGLPKKLFQKAMQPAKPQIEVKALAELKENTRTLGMVLRSERELLNRSKAYEEEISELRLVLESKDGELNKLRNMCMKQREEIKALKDAIMFPDVMNSQLQELLENQGSELKQARQLIPNLQDQVTSLTGQLRNLAEDLAEMKGNKCSRRDTNGYRYQDASNFSEGSSWDPVTPGSLDEMFIKDLNPCLTPHYVRTKSKELVAPMGYGYPNEDFSSDPKDVYENIDSHGGGIFSTSSESYLSLGSGNASSVIWKSGQSKFFSKTPTCHKLF